MDELARGANFNFYSKKGQRYGDRNLEKKYMLVDRN